MARSAGNRRATARFGCERVCSGGHRRREALEGRVLLAGGCCPADPPGNPCDRFPADVVDHFRSTNPRFVLVAHLLQLERWRAYGTSSWTPAACRPDHGRRPGQHQAPCSRWQAAAAQSQPLRRSTGQTGWPVFKLVMEQQQQVYGTTMYGGANGTGTIFELPHGSGTITAPAWFNAYSSPSTLPAPWFSTARATLRHDHPGEPARKRRRHGVRAGQGSSTDHHARVVQRDERGNPWRGLVMDGSGNLYGTTEYGGANSDGTVFEIAGREQHDHHARVVQRNEWVPI